MTPRRRISTDPRATELGPPLRAVGRRLRLRDGVLFATRTLWPALVATAVILGAGRLWPIERLAWWAGAPLLLWLVAVLGYALIRPLPLLTVARRIDVMLSLKERLSTALELATGNAQGELVERQWTDALSAAARLNPRRDVKLTVDRRSLKWAGLAAAAIVILTIVPNPMDAVLARRAAVREATQAQAEEIEELREELHQETTPTSEEREELLRQLAELARQLRENQGAQEDALSDISETEEALRRQLDPQAGANRAALQSLTNQLAQLANQQTNQLANQQTSQPTNQQTTTPQDALSQLADALAGMTPTQQTSLAQQLDQLAAQMAATDADPSTSSGQGLADALSALADAAQQGDAQAGEQAAQSAQAALIRAQRDQDLQAAIARALAELQDSRQAVAQAGPGSEGAGGQGSGGARVQGSGQGQGQGLGQGSGQGGQPGGGGGTNARQLPPASRVGRAGDPTGPARSPDVGELNEVYAPRVPGEAGENDFIQGQQGSAGETQTRQERQPLPGSPGRATVPYSEVLPAYREAAGAALEREYIPPGLRDYVKEYFSRLDPQSGQ